MSFELQPYLIEVPLWTKTSRCAHPPPDGSYFSCWEGNLHYESVGLALLQLSDIIFVHQLPGEGYMRGNL